MSFRYLTTINQEQTSRKKKNRKMKILRYDNQHNWRVPMAAYL